MDLKKKKNLGTKIPDTKIEKKSWSVKQVWITIENVSVKGFNKIKTDK